MGFRTDSPGQVLRPGFKFFELGNFYWEKNEKNLCKFKKKCKKQKKITKKLKSQI